MPVSTQGTAHLFGIQGGVAVMTNATVMSFSLTKAHANSTATKNEIGNEIERRRDDLHQDGSITLRPQAGFVNLVPGATYAYDGVTFEIVSEGNEEQNEGFVAITYTIKASEYITYA